MIMPPIKTVSLCPQCYKEVPAVIFPEDHVWMVKRCPEHGESCGMVERETRWWGFCRFLGCRNIYNGYLMDVTDRCNIMCKYCYHSPNKGTHRGVKELMEDMVSAGHVANDLVILTGGEPSIHPQIVDIVKGVAGSGRKVIMLTNGTLVNDLGLMDTLAKGGLMDPITTTFRAGLSFHREAHNADIRFLEECRKRGWRVETSLYVIDSLDQMEKAVALAKEYRDVVTEVRIKAASTLWGAIAPNKIFVSDMINWLSDKGQTDFVTDGVNNKTSFANVVHDGVWMMLISWYDVYNVDLMDINCGPHYRDKAGVVRDFVSACLINEGMSRGCR